MTRATHARLRFVVGALAAVTALLTFASAASAVGSRVQFLAVCPDGTSFSWGAPTAPATITSTDNLKSVTAAA
jgi:hypothetical protein